MPKSLVVAVTCTFATFDGVTSLNWKMWVCGPTVICAVCVSVAMLASVTNTVTAVGPWTLIMETPTGPIAAVQFATASEQSGAGVWVVETSPSRYIAASAVGVLTSIGVPAAASRAAVVQLIPFLFPIAVATVCKIFSLVVFPAIAFASMENVIGAPSWHCALSVANA